MSRKSRAKSPSPFRRFHSSPELIREVVYLWRAVDHEGEILESYVTKTRDKDAALAFMKKR